jgi:hypothetical protein
MRISWDLGRRLLRAARPLTDSCLHRLCLFKGGSSGGKNASFMRDALHSKAAFIAASNDVTIFSTRPLGFLLDGYWWKLDGAREAAAIYLVKSALGIMAINISRHIPVCP